MYKLLTLLFLLFSLAPQVKSQILPKEGSKLNYRLIGFKYEAIPGANNYSIEIAAGNYDSEDSFKKNIIRTLEAKTNRIIAEVPSFGSQYTWRVIHTSHNSTTGSELHHFSTLSVPEVDTSLARLRIINPATKYKDALVFLDGNRGLYDMNGRVVWYLPDLGLSEIENTNLRDLKLTPQGTITFIIGREGIPMEVNYDGTVLWRAPDNGIVSGDTSEFYHHELTRLTNGNYMVIGNEYVPYMRLRTGDSLRIFFDYKLTPDSFKNYARKLPFVTLIEYTKDKKIVWSWRSSQYFKGSDVHYRTNGSYTSEIDIHANSFFFDEERQVIYLGFRNISRIIKLNYPSGKVTNSFGTALKPGVPQKDNQFFSGQHSVRSSKKNYLYMYNNNIRNPPALPEIVMLRQPTPGKNILEKQWVYKCDTAGATNSNGAFQPYISGGNVIELPDESIFVGMSGISKVFIVNQAKKILWSAVPEKWNTERSRWDVANQYRASIIADKKDIERLVWSVETK